MSVHASHCALPYPIKNARYSMLVPMLDADGDPVAATTPDTEISEDNAAATDAAEEISATSGMDGMALITFTGAETDCSSLAAAFKSASGPKFTLATLYPRVLTPVGTGTLSAGSAGGGTLGTLLAYDVAGCFIKTTGGTGGGGTGGANNQARKMVTYNTGTGAFTVEPNWETTPSTDTTYAVLLPEGVTLGMLRALNPATAGRTIDLDSSSRVLLQPTQSGVTIPTVTTLTNAPSDSAGVTTLLSRIPSALFSGITSLAQWLGLLAGKQTGNSTARTELRATGAGSGTFDETTDALEALRDNVGTAGAGLTAADDAVITAIGALNNLSSAQAQTAAAAALTAYDPPTQAEMNTALNALGMTVLPDQTRKYGVLLATTTTAIRIPIMKAGGGFAESADWTPASGDVKITKDGGAEANPTNLISHVNDAWELILTATELEAKSLTVKIEDQSAPKVIADAYFLVYTFGDASAFYPDDYSVAGATDADVEAIKAVTDKLDDTLEDDAGTYRFTTNALEQAPGGGSGVTDWTADERTALRAILGIPGSGTTPADPGTGILDTIRDQIATRASQTSVDDLPTNAELATALAAADDAILAAIAALNNLSSAQAQTAAAAALTAYDPPTHTELTTALAAADDAVLAAIAALNNLSSAAAQSAAAAALAAYDPPTKAELDTAVDALPTAVENADAMLARNAKGSSNGPAEESVSAMLAGGALRFSIGGSTLTVRYADGTVAFTRTLTRAEADAITAAVP